LRVQLKDAPSLASQVVRTGEQPRVKIKNREKIEKSVDAFLAFQLEASSHDLSAAALAKADPNSIHFNNQFHS
jgi:hypothetical protein